MNTKNANSESADADAGKDAKPKLSKQQEEYMKLQQVLTNIEWFVAKHPDKVSLMQEAIQRGIMTALVAHRDRAADMEVATSVLLMRHKRGYTYETVLSKLRKWQGKTALLWDSTIQELELKIEAVKAKVKK